MGFPVELPNMMMDLEMDLLATGNNLDRAFNSAASDLNTPIISTDLDNGKILAANIDTPQQHTAMETKEDVWGHESFDVFSTMDYGLCLPATLVEGSLADSSDSVIVPVSSPSASFYINKVEEEEVKIKLEPLSEDEKYRKMRKQNNDASKRCRENRKRKAKEMEEES